jgi:hypothetical protein
MNLTKEQKSVDTHLLSDAITALNIARHKAGMYPQGHPAIEASLTRSLEALRKLLRREKQITLAAAKDVLFADECELDTNNRAFRELALCLSSKSIATVTFTRGLTEQELCVFQWFLAIDPGDASPDDIEDAFCNCGLSHISAEFIDYEAFSFVEGKIENEEIKKGIWSRYIQDLLKGTLRHSKNNFIRSIPPEVLSLMINETDQDQLTGEACDRVMAAYLWQSLEKVSWITDINKLAKFINRLRPELKEQLLSSSLRTLPADISMSEEMLEAIDANEAMELLETINENSISIPEAIKNLIEKFSMISTEGLEGRISGSGLIIDDIPLPYEITPISAEDDFKKFVTDTYTRELQALLAFDAGEAPAPTTQQAEHDWNDESFEKDFHQIILELVAINKDDLINRQDYEYFSSLLKEQIEHFIGTGQYAQVVKILSIAQSGKGNGGSQLADLDLLTPEMAASLVDSFRLVGVKHREDALRLCRCFGHMIVPPLLEALISEGARRTRKFLLDLAVHLADQAVAESVKHLSDTRWYVKRNMLLILSESSSSEALPHVRPYCYHDNLKVSFYALRYLLKTDERYGIEALKHYLRSESADKVDMALRISSTYGINAIVPELISKLRKMDRRDADLNSKIAIVKALGQLGDPRALGTLKSILATRSLFFRDPLKKLKEEVTNTLKNYPPEDVRAMISSFLEIN